MAKKVNAGLEHFGDNLSFAAKEAYKKLRVNLMISLSDDKKCHVVGITSAQPSEGKSTTAMNIAYSLAETGKKVLIIDGDLRRPSLHVKLDTQLSPGLSNLLTDTNSISAVIKTYKDESGIAFDIISGGDIPENPSELLNSQRMSRLMDALKGAYDLIIIDLPPVGAVIDAVSVAKNTDGMIVVLRENNCAKVVFTNCVEQLKFAKVRILGFVVNGSTEGAGKKYGYGGYSYGYGSYTSDNKFSV